MSSVTGQNLELLKQFLNMIPPRQSQEDQERLIQEEPEYLVSTFHRLILNFSRQGYAMLSNNSKLSI